MVGTDGDGNTDQWMGTTTHYITFYFCCCCAIIGKGTVEKKEEEKCRQSTHWLVAQNAEDEMFLDKG